MTAACPKLLAGLNPEQMTAVTAGVDTNLLVLAGAGCGKTTVLVRRIGYLCQNHCSADHILALTFSRKAAEEMAARLPPSPGKARLGVVSTFHAFALSVITHRIEGELNARRLGFSTVPEILTQRDRLNILSQITTAQQRRSLGVDLIRLDDLLSTREVCYPPDSAPADEQATLIQSIQTRMDQQKRLRGVWDFSDMVGQALRLFQNHPDIARHYAGKFRAVLVDEFQDTNPLQIELLRSLLGQGAHLYAVGDDDQAIYGFRGADTTAILNFNAAFPPASLVKLQTNYRSTPAVLTAANRIFRNKPKAYRKVLRCGREGTQTGPRPIFRTFQSRGDLVGFVLRTIADLHRREAIAPESMAMLFRVNQSLEQTRALLPEQTPLPRLLTVHGSKGLEFPVVFLCDLEEGVFPNYRIAARPDGIAAYLRSLAGITRPDCDLQEEKRLFYVGVTRAARWLFLLNLKERETYGRKKRFRPSRFLRIIR